MERPTTMIPKTPEQQTLTDALMDADPLRNLFGMERVENLRAQQRTAHDEAFRDAQQRGIQEELASQYATNAVFNTVESYMGARGFDSQHEKYEQVKDGLIKLSVLNVPEEDWHVKVVTSPDGTQELGQSGRELTRATYNEISGKEYMRPRLREFTDEEQENIKNLHVELDELRDKLALLSAKRQGRVVGSGGEAYQQALEEYNTHLVALGELENEPITENHLLDKDEKNFQVVQYLFEEQRKLRELTTEKLKDTTVGKIVGWMTRGNWAVRILKGVAVGASAGVLAAGVGALAGVAGAAAIGTGIAGLATAAVRFGRGYAMADARSGRGINVEADGAKVFDAMRGKNADAPDYVKNIADLFGHQFEQDTKKEQAKRRKSVAWGLGTLAVGGAIGTVAALGVDALANGGFGVQHDPIFGHHQVEATDAGGADSAGSGVEDHSMNQEWYQEHQQILAEQAAAQAAQEAAEQQAEQALNAQFYIQPGEGGIHFFSRLGLSRDQWYQVQDELFNRFPKEFYQSPGQAVRISAAGPLSDGAREYIKSAFGL